MRSQSSCISDQRIKITSDMIQGVKVIKLYAWEESFMQKLLDIRTRELKSVGRINILRALNAGLLSVGWDDE